MQTLFAFFVYFVSVLFSLSLLCHDQFRHSRIASLDTQKHKRHRDEKMRKSETFKIQVERWSSNKSVTTNRWRKRNNRRYTKRDKWHKTKRVTTNKWRKRNNRRYTKRDQWHIREWMRELNRNTKRVTANSGKSGTKERKRYKERERERAKQKKASKWK